KIVQDYPFSIYQGETLKSYGRLGSKEFAVLSYVMKTDENALEGNNELEIQCSPDPAEGIWISKKIKIKVQTRYPTLNVVDVKTDPEFIEPGQKAQLLISLENLADSSMKDINVKLDFENSDLAPYGEIGEKKLRRLNSGEIGDLIFNIVALADASGGIYKIPLSISYSDALGNEYGIEGKVAIEINSNPDIKVYVDSSTLTKSHRSGEIILKLVNSGLTDLKFMNIKLLKDNTIKILSSSEVYVGDVDSDDYETIEYRIHAKSNKINLPLSLDYRDVNNKKHHENINVSYSLLSSSELNGKSRISGFLIFLLIITVIVIWKRKILIKKIKSFRK
ncbi:hypothetical protein DRN69_04960, partial [Candidatus Pacearchaeota archaeon]